MIKGNFVKFTRRFECDNSIYLSSIYRNASKSSLIASAENRTAGICKQELVKFFLFDPKQRQLEKVKMAKVELSYNTNAAAADKAQQ